MATGYTRISTNFDVRLARPLDARFAVATLAERDALQFAYAGLLLFVEEDATLYYLSRLPASEPANWQVVGSGAGGGDMAFNGERPLKRVPSVGQRPGGATVQEFLNGLFYPFVGASLSLGGVPLQEKGTTVTLNLQAGIAANDETVFENGRVTDRSGAVVATFPAAPGNHTATPIAGVETDQRYTARLDVANDGEPETLSATREVRFVAPTFYGSGPEGLDEAGIKSLAKVLRGRGSHQNVAFSPVNERFYYVYPESFGPVRQIIDPNNFDVTASFRYRQENLALADGTLEAYRIYYNNSDTTQSGFRLDFIF